MVTVHHLEDSRSQRILWLLEELGVDYQVKRYARDKATRLAPASLKAIHPLGKSPVIEDAGLIVAETGAIVEFLVDKYGAGKFRPTGDPQDRLRYVYWMHFAEGSAMPQLLLKLFFMQIKAAKMPFFAKPIAAGIANKVLSSYVDPNIAAQFDYIENELNGREWLAGPALSGADIMMSFPMEAAKDRIGLAGRPNCTAYLKRIQERPAYQRALEKGGPYAYG
ncbi:MAG: glutathione S-transferase [Pseudomonadota bacterium]